MADGQIREDKVTCWRGAVEVGHARYRSTSQYRKCGLRGRRGSALSDWASVFERSKQEEVGVVLKGDVVLSIRAFIDAQVNNGRWIDRASVGGGCAKLAFQLAGSIAYAAHIWLRNRKLSHARVAE